MSAREFGRRGLLFVGGSVIGLVLLETGLQLGVRRPGRANARDADLRATQELFESDPELGWKGRSFATGTLHGPGYTSSARLNSLGFREREIGEKLPGVTRILVFGDSQTWGLGVDQDERYSDALETALRARGFNAEVLNFGMNGYGTDQELLLFMRLGAVYRPDIVVLAFYWNDLVENSLDSAYTYTKPRFVIDPSGSLVLRALSTSRHAGSSDVNRASTNQAPATRKGWLREHSAVYGSVMALGNRHPALYALLLRTGLAAGPNAVEWVTTRLLIERFRDQVQASGSRFLVVILPERGDLEGNSAFVKSYLLDDLRSLPVLDMLPALRAAGPPDRSYSQDRIHLNREGHRVVGAALCNFLVGIPRTFGHSVAKE